MSFTATCERFCVYFLAAACRIMTLSDFSVILEKSRPFPAWKTKKNIIKNLGRNRKKTKGIVVVCNKQLQGVQHSLKVWILNRSFKHGLQMYPSKFCSFFFLIFFSSWHVVVAWQITV